MSSEKTFRAYMAKGLKPYGHIVQIENEILVGQPDTNYCVEGSEGNIELKYISEWPKRRGNIVRIHHYTKEQRMWIFKRAMALGSVFLFVKVVNEYFLFTAFPAIEKVGINLTMHGFYGQAYHTWADKINFEELKEVLKKWESFRHAEKDILKRLSSKAIQFT